MEKAKNTICLWFNKDALDAANFYAATFPNSAVTGVHRAPGDFPSGKQGEVLTVEFTVLGIPCLGLNGGRCTCGFESVGACTNAAKGSQAFGSACC